MRFRASTIWLSLVLGPVSVHAQSLNVFAAASLKESVSEIARSFERQHPTCKVNLNFGGSQLLVAQIRQGAPVDVLLTAGAESLRSLRYDRSSERIFANNHLAIVVPAASSKVRSLRDLSNGIHLIVADRHVPVGRYAEEMLAKAKSEYGQSWANSVNNAIVSREQDVRGVLAKVSLKEADAGIVYVTDYLTAKNKVRLIPIPERFAVTAMYPAVRFGDSSNSTLARAFTDFLFQPAAQQALMKHGFGSPVPVKGDVRQPSQSKKHT